METTSFTVTFILIGRPISLPLFYTWLVKCVTNGWNGVICLSSLSSPRKLLGAKLLVKSSSQVDLKW